MPKLFQINVVSNVLSTGKIVEDISKVAVSNGWETYIAFGRDSKPSISEEIRIGGMLDVYFHYLLMKLFDREGLASKIATRRLIGQIDKIKPDIVHLHNLHDHYLNYPELFVYLSKINVPVVWTQHDCWAFTGGCTYFDLHKCDKWKSECDTCPACRAFFNDLSNYHFNLKKTLLNRINHIAYVPVSDWLCKLLKSSHQSNREIVTIHNGVDIDLFHPYYKRKLHDNSRFSVLGVAAVWDRRKGLNDFLELRRRLSFDYEIVLVGLSKEQIASLPAGIKGISRTANIDELVKLYSKADVFVNPTYSDNFPTTNIEALACGTPVITYNTGGSPEAIDENTGVVVPQGNIGALVDAIINMRRNPLSSEDCRNRAVNVFNKTKCFEKYIRLYERLMLSSGAK